MVAAAEERSELAVIITGRGHNAVDRDLEMSDALLHLFEVLQSHRLAGPAMLQGLWEFVRGCERKWKGVFMT
jgi:hypothetical protein